MEKGWGKPIETDETYLKDTYHGNRVLFRSVLLTAPAIASRWQIATNFRGALADEGSAICAQAGGEQ